MNLHGTKNKAWLFKQSFSNTLGFPQSIFGSEGMEWRERKPFKFLFPETDKASQNSTLLFLQDQAQNKIKKQA